MIIPMLIMTTMMVMMIMPVAAARAPVNIKMKVFSRAGWLHKIACVLFVSSALWPIACSAFQQN